MATKKTTTKTKTKAPKELNNSHPTVDEVIETEETVVEAASEGVEAKSDVKKDKPPTAEEMVALKARIAELEGKEAKVEPLVAVEMTEAERDEFVSFKKDKIQAQEDEDAHKADKMVNMRLSTKHFINGKKFGPGVAAVPEYLVGKLQSNEAAWRDHELSIFAPSKTHLKKILEGGVVLDVSPGQAPKSVQNVFGG